MSVKGQGGGGVTGAGAPGPPNTSIQFNSGGGFGGDANLTWLAADGLTNLKHAAFGATSAIDATAPTIIDVQESFTTDLSTGVSSICEVNPSAGGDSFYSGYFELNSRVGNANGILSTIPLSGVFQHNAASTINSVTVVDSEIYNNVGGTISAIYGFYSGLINSATGIITDYYGFFCSNPLTAGGVITNAYGIFVDNINTASVLNFAIKTGTGVVSFGDNVVTTADMKAATYHVGAAAGIDASITTAALVGKTITVSKGLITGFA